VLLLAGCPGGIMTPLPAGFGPGVYHGTFQTENGSGDFADAGQITLTVLSAGQTTATGELNGNSIEVTGLLDSTGHLDGNITDTLSGFSGDFSGQLSGTTLSGDFRLQQESGDDITGVWDATYTQ
jgi:hypothetical protein